MSSSLGWGIGLVVLGGFLNGSFALPMKRMPAWPWENTWLIYSLAGLVVVPWSLALGTVPHLAFVYQQASWATLVKVAVFGFGWGVGSTFFGLGIRRVGMALGFAIILGVTASLGSLLPMAVLHPEQLATGRGLNLIAGLILVIAGVSFCSLAGWQRERDAGTTASSRPRSGFAFGLVICLLSGIFSAMLNFSFVFGKDLDDLARSAGASTVMAANSIWALALAAGFVANAGYCLHLLRKNHTWEVFTRRRVPLGYWLGGVVMGVVWFSGIAVYGMGAAMLGPMGGILGWPVFMVMVIVAGNIWGAVTGEWKGASRRAYGYLYVGIAILLLAIYFTSRGGGGA